MIAANGLQAAWSFRRENGLAVDICNDTFSSEMVFFLGWLRNCH